MKTQKLFLGAALILGLLAANGTKTIKATAIKASEAKQCGVGSDQITSYLQNCSHHHTTYWVQDIAGTCNTNVGIENSGVATVYVSDGAIVGHVDSYTNQ